VGKHLQQEFARLLRSLHDFPLALRQLLIAVQQVQESVERAEWCSIGNRISAVPDESIHVEDLPKLMRHRSKEVGLGRGRFLSLLSMLAGLVEGFFLRRDHLEVLSCPHLTKWSAHPHVVHLN
jgi:hypothetical protein